MSVTVASATPRASAAIDARVGPLHARLATLASAWRDHNGYRVCTRVEADADDHGPWLSCLTHLARIGFKGRGTAAWLEAEGVIVPSAPNRWLRHATGAIIARLGAEDFLISEELDGGGDLPQQLLECWHGTSARGGHPVPRQHALATLAVVGESAPALFARLCAVDLSALSFATDAIAQTQLALISAIILRSAASGPPSYRVHVDTSLALYLWDVLHDVATALGGGVIGEAQLVRP